MIFTDYQPLALRTEKPLPTPLERLAHATLGLITEIGEITTEVKRIVIYGKQLADVDTKTQLTRAQHIAEEIGDVLWYLAIAADTLGLDLAAHDVAMNIPEGEFSVNTMLQYVVMGLAKGAGEFGTQIGANLFDRDLYDAEKLESAAVHTYYGLKAVALIIDTPLERIMAANIAKLRERFPDAYSDEAAEARADKGGADARSS